MKFIQTNGIQYLEILSEGSSWYCGTDYTCGDLYEAEEVFQNTGTCRPNRLIFVHYPDGTVYEPLKLVEGQYFGRPAEANGKICFFYVDFGKKEIKICECEDGLAEIHEIVTLSTDICADCYNLLLHTSPLMLTRQGGENTFEVLWPETTSFEIGPNESFIRREGDKLLFSTWYEDPEYREEVIVREWSSGTVLERIPGNLFIAPNKEIWVIG